MHLNEGVIQRTIFKHLCSYLTLSSQGIQAYEEVLLSHKTVSSEDDKKEREGSEKEVKIP